MDGDMSYYPLCYILDGKYVGRMSNILFLWTYSTRPTFCPSIKSVIQGGTSLQNYLKSREIMEENKIFLSIFLID